MTLQCEREIKDISRSNDNAILPFRPSSCAADNLKSGVNIKLRPGRNTNAQPSPMQNVVLGVLGHVERAVWLRFGSFTFMT